MAFKLGDEVSIYGYEGSATLVPCEVMDRYEHNGEWWLVLRHKETGTRLRRPEKNFEKPYKGIKLAEGGKY